MSTTSRADHEQTGRPNLDMAPSSGDRNLARLLALLNAGDGELLSVAALQAEGIRSPAQTVYELQLAGYDVERAYGASGGHQTPGYRIRRHAAP